MVQYIVTPWRDHQELISVREHLYPGDQPPSSSTSGDLSDSLPWSVVYAASSLTSISRAEADQRLAVGRVQMWAHRGNCPHLVESTGLLVAVVLDDVDQSRRQRSGRPASSSLSDFAVRAAYATAFSRFVTGLLDSQQDKQKKQSMYSLAKTIGLPATFVELRHQATHEQLPSLLRLRGAAKKALSWIWDFYWRDLVPANDTMTNPGQQGAVTGNTIGMVMSGSSTGGNVQPGAAAVATNSLAVQQLDLASLPPLSCEEVLIGFMRGKLDEATARIYLAEHDEALIIKTTDAIGNSTDDMRIMTRALRLVGAMIEGKCPLITKKSSTVAVTGAETVAAGGGLERKGQEKGSGGWHRRPRESWNPKPIGIV